MMTVGYPITDAALDAMYEADLAQKWEEQNRDPETDRYGVYYELGNAWEDLSSAYNHLAEAVEKAAGHAVEDRISSVLNDVDELEKEIQKIRERLMKEVKSA